MSINTERNPSPVESIDQSLGYLETIRAALIGLKHNDGDPESLVYPIMEVEAKLARARDHIAKAG